MSANPVPDSSAFPTRRDIHPEEMAAIAQLAVRVPDLRQVPRMLDELERLRAAPPAALPAVIPLRPGTRPAGGPIQPRNVREILLLRAATPPLLTDLELRELLGYPPPEPIREPEPPERLIPLPPHFIARGGWGGVWRLVALASVTGLFDLPGPAPWVFIALSGALVAVGARLGWWRRRSLLGSAWRLAAACGLFALALTVRLPILLTSSVGILGAFVLAGDAIWNAVAEETV